MSNRTRYPTGFHHVFARVIGSIIPFGAQSILLYQRRNWRLVCASICSVLLVHHEYTVALGSTDWRKRMQNAMCIPRCHKRQLMWMLCSFTSQLGPCSSQFSLLWVVKKDIEGKHFWQDRDLKAVDQLVQILSPYLLVGIIHERQISNWFADCMEKWWAFPLFFVLDMCWGNKYHVTFTLCTHDHTLCTHDQADCTGEEKANKSSRLQKQELSLRDHPQTTDKNSNR